MLRNYSLTWRTSKLKTRNLKLKQAAKTLTLATVALSLVIGYSILATAVIGSQLVA